MDTPDDPLDPAVVFEALTESYAVLFADSPDPAFRIHRAATWVAGVTPLPLVPYNRVMGVRAADGEADAVIDDVAAWFGDTRYGYWLDPMTTPGDFVDRLRARGFDIDQGTPAMGMRLDHLPALDVPDGVELVPVRTAEAMATTQRVVGEGFGLPPAMTETLVETMPALSDGSSGPLRSVIATLDGVPVATAMHCLAGEVAGIYAVATLEAARGRGLGRMVTLATMLEARDRGARLAVLESSDMGYPVYRRMGYDDVGPLTIAVPPG